MTEPIFSVTMERLWSRLPEFMRNLDSSVYTGVNKFNSWVGTPNASPSKQLVLQTNLDPITRTNLFPYPSFEDGTTNGGGTFAGANRSCSIVNSTDVAYLGTKSLKYLAGTGKDLINARYFFLAAGLSVTPVTPFVPTTISEYVYSPVATSVQMYLDVYSGSGYLATLAGSFITIPAGVWTRVFITFTPPANSTFIAPAIRDNPSSPFPFRENLFTNPSFEGIVTGWASRWFGGGGGAGTSGLSTVSPLYGSYSFRKTWTAAPTNSQDTGFSTDGTTKIQTTTGTTNTFSAYLRSSRAQVMQAFVFYYDVSGVQVGSAVFGNQVSCPANQYTRVSITDTVPVGATQAVVAWGPYNGAISAWQVGDTLDIDGAMWEVGSSLGTYFDGSTGGAYQRWSGTANASTSIDSPPLYIDAVLLEQSATLNPYFDGSVIYPRTGVVNPLKTWLSGIVDQLGDLDTTIERINFLPIEQRIPYRKSLDQYTTYARPVGIEDPTYGWATLGATSDLLDGRTADPAWLTWLELITGAKVLQSDTVSQQRDKTIFSYTSYQAGSVQSMISAMQSVLTGGKYAKVYDHSTVSGLTIVSSSSEWDVVIVTKAIETPGGTNVANVIIGKGAKPAGVNLHYLTYNIIWSILESSYSTWTSIDALGTFDTLETAS